MYWYNPTTRHDEDVPTPPNDARAIEMLSGHPDSEEFIEEYRRNRRKTHGIEKAMIITGEAFFRNHHPADNTIRGTLLHPLCPLDGLSAPLRVRYKRDGLRIL